MLRTTIACTFSTAQLPKVLRTGGVCANYSTCASRRSRMHFFNTSISKSALLWTIFFTIFTSKCASRHFRPSGAAKLEKNTLSRDFSTFSRALTFFLLISLSDLFSTDSLFSDFFSFLTVLVTAAASLHESEI